MSSQLPVPSKRATAQKVYTTLGSPDISNVHFIITGANSGIGFETCRALALSGGNIVMACRNVPAGARAREKILKEKADANIYVMQLDLADLSSIEQFVADFREQARQVHVLINNAGVFSPKKRITKDNFETTFQTNHLGHFYLVQLIEDILIANAPSRIINVSSRAIEISDVKTWTSDKFTWKNLSPTKEHSDKMNSAYKAYAISKLCNVLHALELNHRLKDKGITACSLHPGIIKTNGQRNDWASRAFICCCLPLVSSAQTGAATTVYCALVDDLASFGGGKYFDQCRVKSYGISGDSLENALALKTTSDNMINQWKIKENMNGK